MKKSPKKNFQNYGSMYRQYGFFNGGKHGMNGSLSSNPNTDRLTQAHGRQNLDITII